jgi:hypothetical protein
MNEIIARVQAAKDQVVTADIFGNCLTGQIICAGGVAGGTGGR